MKDKYLSKALKTLGWELDEGLNIKSKKDLEKIINESSVSIEEMDQIIFDMEEIIEKAKRTKEKHKANIEEAKNLIYQMEVEEYKELNPGIDIF